MTTNRIPLWPGARVTVTEHGVSWSAHVLGVKSAGVLVAWLTSDRKDRAGLDYFDADQVVPDFTDPDTFRGAVARLAEALGAPPEAVAVGVTFEGDSWGWLIAAGGTDFSAEDYVWSQPGRLAPGILDPAEALTAAWAQAPVPLDRMGTKAGLRAAWAQVLAEVKP